MRKSLLVILGCALYGYADVSISTVESISQPLKPDQLRGYLSYHEESKNVDTIKNDLNLIIAEVKHHDPKGEWCKGGGYQISPRYTYKDQKQEFAGYSGYLSFECSFGAVEPYNALSASIDRISAPSVRKEQGALSWVVSEKSREALKSELKGKLIVKAYNEAKRFSAITANDCKVSTIAFGGFPQSFPVAFREKAVAMAAAPTQSPLQSDEEISLEANVGYVCAERSR